MKARDELRLSGARIDGADYSGRRLAFVTVANGSRLTGCDFRGVHATDGCLGAGLRPSVYTGCVFDGATLRGPGLDPGRATFISCSFREASLIRLSFLDAEFVDCVFSGRIEGVTFSAEPWARDAELGRTVNRYEGNDFSAARMTDVDFRGGVDLDRQRLPQGHLVLRDAAARLDAAAREIAAWADPADRDEAESTLETLRFDVDGGQRDLFTDREFLVQGLSPGAAARLLAVLEDRAPGS
ncbi:hypothetical protein MF672_027500 [Actinomadura sp. ATCC 31491]|uniref:Pentapeptide repeat-containing protein n=1 Tax=Actinomadura luzonensis TaxID=2805427 RepID=A0ABT0FYT5_9ACTN|nr:hypothetical protein [Actinomadura luzonensis]MCK2217508.1 hypothetical protein [Actinomadura luzonensis]